MSVKSPRQQYAYTEEMQELVNDFIHESMANLERSEQLVESLGTDDVRLIEQNINVLFRTFHSIKGVAGFLQFAVLQSITHEAETLLGSIRKRPARQSEEILQAIYRIFDGIRYIIREVEKHGSDITAQEKTAIFIAQIQQFIAPEERIDLDGNSLFPHTRSGASSLMAEMKLPLSSPVLHTADIMIARNKIATLGIVLQSLTLSQDTRNAILPIRLLIDELLVQSRVSDESEVHLLGKNALFFSDMLSSGDLAFNETTLVTFHAQVTSFLEALEKYLQIQEQSEKPASQALDYFVLSQSVGLADDFYHAEKEEQKVDGGAVYIDQIYSNDEAAKGFGKSTFADRSEIRVETAKLDRLFDLMSELVTLQAMTLNNPDLQDLDLPNFQQSAAMLAKNIRQLQGITMSMRMTPIEILFAKMKRITREVAAQLGKRVELRLSGADTEMDKNVIELLFDPLVHILRNAIDHGIESPAEREERGKSATSMIHLSALYEGNEILIVIRDDGVGLNRSRILHRAIERGIAPPNTDTLTDEEVWNFIFEPGFSTADAVTDISGRGVGMDVVKQNIAKMRGSVHIRSREGKGATVTLKIPLTLASMDVILVRVGDTHYAIPVGVVRQSFRPILEDITKTMDGLEVVCIRERLYSIMRLHEIFRLDADTTIIDEGILIIVEANGRTVCLFVDEIVGQQQTVIKPLAKYIGEVRGLKGCMILSNGTVGLVLDVEELIRIAEESLIPIA